MSTVTTGILKMSSEQFQLFLQDLGFALLGLTIASLLLVDWSLWLLGSNFHSFIVFSSRDCCYDNFVNLSSWRAFWKCPARKTCQSVLNRRSKCEKDILGFAELMISPAWKCHSIQDSSGIDVIRRERHVEYGLNHFDINLPSISFCRSVSFRTSVYACCLTIVQCPYWFVVCPVS